MLLRDSIYPTTNNDPMHKQTQEEEKISRFIKLIGTALKTVDRQTLAMTLPEIVELVSLGLDGSLREKCDVLDRPTLTQLLDADQEDALGVLRDQGATLTASLAKIGKFAKKSHIHRLVAILNGKPLTLD